MAVQSGRDLAVAQRGKTKTEFSEMAKQQKEAKQGASLGGWVTLDLVNSGAPQSCNVGILVARTGYSEHTYGASKDKKQPEHSVQATFRSESAFTLVSFLSV